MSPGKSCAEEVSGPALFAAGDVTGHSMLVSSVLLEGPVAAENAVLGPRRIAH
jgi:pyruvate/2-oxoglutarate dehydrogenase complex dihydrolipoamide dehydrogenase (E3) component